MLRVAKPTLLTLLVIALSISGILSIFTNQTTSAADSIGLERNDDLYANLTAHQHAWWLYGCFKVSDIDKVTKSEVDNWDFFEGSNTTAALGGMYGKGESGQSNNGTGTLYGYRKCSDQTLVKRAFNFLGFDNSRETFCSIDGAQYGGDNADRTTCLRGAGNKDWDNNANRNKRTDWYKSDAFSKKNDFISAAEYYRAYLSLTESCGVEYVDSTLYDTEAEVPSTGDDDKYAMPIVVKSSDTAYSIKFAQGVGESSSDFTKIALVGDSNELTSDTIAGAQFFSCNELVNKARDTAGAYATYLSVNGSDTTEDTGNDGSTGGTEATTCAVDGIGWIVCPVMKFVGKMNDVAFGTLQHFLAVKPDVVSDDATIGAWSAFRDVANIAFIIAFLIIVYSQVTSAGVSNYGIKKLLPRIVVAAVLVNLSYFICAVLVDVSNIAGGSLYSLFKNFSDTVGVDISTNSWEGSVTTALAGATGVALIVIALFLFLGPAALLALAIILLILIARQALVILLIVVSPLAFVAYLLPNTESWFKKWWKALTATLMVYPIIAAVFGASTLASSILSKVSQGQEDASLLQLMALGVLAVPLFAVPALLKGALSAAGSIGGRLQGLADRASKGTLDTAKKGRSGEFLAARQAAKQRRRVERRIGEGRLAKWGESREEQGKRGGKALKYIGQTSKRFDRSPAGRFLGGDRGAASAVSEYDHALDEETKRQETLLSGQTAKQLLDTLHTGKGSAEQRAAVVRRIVKVGGDQHVQAAIDHLSRTADQTGVGDVQKLSADALLSRKGAGIGTDEAKQLVNGQLGYDKKTGNFVGGGYLDSFKDRVKQRKLGAGDFGKMGKDDIIRLAELSASGDLDADDKNYIDDQLKAIRGDETLKGTMTGEREALFGSVLSGTGPRNAAGGKVELTALTPVT